MFAMPSSYSITMGSPGKNGHAAIYERRPRSQMAACPFFSGHPYNINVAEYL